VISLRPMSSTVDILIRDVPVKHADRLAEIAEKLGESRTVLMHHVIASYIADTDDAQLTLLRTLKEIGWLDRDVLKKLDL
jgi:predicted DNA-binding protein